MARIVIANAFSVNMLTGSSLMAMVKIDTKIARELVHYASKNDLPIFSIVGHESTAKLLTRILEYSIETDRTPHIIADNEILLVFTVPFRLDERQILTLEQLERLKETINVYMVLKVIDLSWCDSHLVRSYILYHREVEEFLKNFMSYLKEKDQELYNKLADQIFW